MKWKKTKYFRHLLSILLITSITLATGITAFAAGSGSGIWRRVFHAKLESVTVPVTTPAPKPQETPKPAKANNKQTCRITGADTVTFTASFASAPASDDGKIHVYELACYEYAIPAGRADIASVPSTTDPAVTFPLSNRLYSKFAMAVIKNGSPEMLDEPQFITNPEALATHTRPKAAHGLKGLQGDTFTNLWLNGSPSAHLASLLPRTVQLMNQGTNQTITNPYSRPGAADQHPVTTYGYYMLNANEQAGVEALAYEAAFYAANSNADVFIVGNEVNVRGWNYMAWTGNWDEYVKQYTQAFRVIYNAIKSQNANAEVVICLDCQWDRNRAPGHAEYYEYMDAKDFMDAFNTLIKAGGNIDWGVAHHPHTCPLTYAKFWDMSGQPDGAYYAAQISGNKMISFQNLSVITNYLQRADMLKPNGQMRYYTISEMGLANGQGEEVQAAAIGASYEAARRNGHVDEVTYIVGPQIGVDFSLSGQAETMFNGLGGPETENLLNWARSYIGVDDWGQVLR